jgi:hypothetical protein
MKTIASILILMLSGAIYGQYPDGNELIRQIDANMSSDSRIFTSKMIIHGKRGTRTVESRKH